MKKKIDLPDVTPVHLPSVGPVRPGIYVLAGITLVILVLVFLIGFLPGILHGGRTLTFTSGLDNTGVVVDGTYVSGTPSQKFIDSGDHHVQFIKAGVVINEQSIHVNHPVFLTWLKFRYQDVSMTTPSLTDEQKNTIRNFDLQLIMNQSALLDFDRVHNYIPYFMSYAKDAVALSFSSADIEQDMKIACSFITTTEMYQDAKAAFDYIGQEPNSMFEKATTLFSETADKNTMLGSPSKNTPSPSLTPDSLQLGDATVEGVKVSAHTFMMGTEVQESYPAINTLSYQADIPSFSLASLPVSEYLYALFVQDNPYWSKANKKTLIENNEVSENYLAGITLSTTLKNESPIRNISYYAAVAFTNWASEVSGKHVFLPTEEMWEAAANLTSSSYATSLVNLDTSDTPFKMMMGGVWEMTSTPYIPLARMEAQKKQSLESLVTHEGFTVDHIVKGGSILNEDAVTSKDIGAISPTDLNDYIGLRLAWD